MTTAPEILRLHVDYMGWASARILDAAARLAPDELARDFGTADGSVLGTMVHIFSAERIWLRRIRGEDPGDLSKPESLDLPTLREDWSAVQRDWRDWAAGIGVEEASAMISYHDLRGNPWQTPLWQIVLHVVNHGTHHRGQISGFLRAMGHVPPPLDLIAYCRGL